MRQKIDVIWNLQFVLVKSPLAVFTSQKLLMIVGLRTLFWGSFVREGTLQSSRETLSDVSIHWLVNLRSQRLQLPFLKPCQLCKQQTTQKTACKEERLALITSVFQLDVRMPAEKKPLMVYNLQSCLVQNTVGQILISSSKVSKILLLR